MGSELQPAYDADRQGNSRLAVNCIIEVMDDLLHDGNFAKCDELLRTCDIDKMSMSSIVSMLGITTSAKEKLPSRSDFYLRVAEAFGNPTTFERYR